MTLIALTAGWQTAIVFAICYFAYLQFEAYFISPRIMQKAVAVPGAVAVISVIAGGSLLGVLGRADRHPHGGGHHAAGQGNLHRPPGQPLTGFSLRKRTAAAWIHVAAVRSGILAPSAQAWAVATGPSHSCGSSVPRCRSGAAGEDLVHDLVEHPSGVLLPHPQVLGAVHPHHLRLRHQREPRGRSRRLEVVVVLGDQDLQRLAGRRPIP